MHRKVKVAVGLLVFLSACNLVKDKPMTNELLAITAKCRENDQCLFEGQDMFLDISITNNHKSGIGFPLAYLQKTGPIIRLIDTRTKAETNLKTNLADFDLREKFTLIQPGKAVLVEWVISSYELQQFGGDFVDLSAEITVMARIQVSGKQVDFRGTDTLQIVSKDKP